MTRVAELVFFSGTMDCGKSTLALQMDHNHRSRGRAGVLLTSRDRAGNGRLSSRLGLHVDAVEVDEGFNVWAHVVELLQSGRRVDYLICDEVQFWTAEQVEELARLVDELGVDVFAFGITTDFRTRLFPGSARLIELADRVQVLQVEALCWCGARATHNARTVDGVMVLEGAQVVVGDTGLTGVGDGVGDGAARVGVVGYEVLCRAHHRRRMTAAAAHSGVLSPETLPFGAADADAERVRGSVTGTGG
jgi:thymidine kinase